MSRHTKASSRARPRFAWLALPVLACALALAAAALCGSAAAATCANEARRAEQAPYGPALPDCRAYELVTPDSLISQTSSQPARASTAGGALAYYTTHPSAEAVSSSYFYRSTRGTDGWSVRSIGPQAAPAALFEDECEQNVFFSPDLSRNVDEEGWGEEGQPARCKSSERVLVPGEPFGYRNVFLHEIASGANRLVNVTPAGLAPANAKFQDASDDFTRIFFSEEARLAPEAPDGNAFYVWSDGVVQLLTRLPDGSPTSGELVEAAGYRAKTGVTVEGSGFAPVAGAVSADGARAFFYAADALYMRLNPDRPQSAIGPGGCTDPAAACTVQVDASQGPGAGGGGVFWRASADGSRVFFSSDHRLTADSTAVAGKADLYEFDAGSGQLTDLTVSAGAPADVRGVSGIGEDGSYLYFAANGVLAPGASPGSCEGAEASGQSCNLYVAHDGTIRFVATLARWDRLVWQEPFGASPDFRRRLPFLSADVSPSGRYLAFGSLDSLTGYDNYDPVREARNRQIFLYDAAAGGGTGELSCVSCNHGSVSTDFSLEVTFGGENGSSPGGNASWATNTVLDDGRVYFDSAERLVAADVNSARDVYEYRAGERRLITPGDDEAGARFLDTSPGGEDVFFRTPQSLIAVDLDHDHTSIYDARVGGGFAMPAPPSPCYGESCRGGEPAPPVSVPATAGFQGSGNAKPRRPKKPKRCRARGKRKQHHHRCKRPVKARR